MLIDKEYIKKIFSELFSDKAQLLSVHSVSGGSINEVFKLTTSEGLFFLKLNSAVRYPEMFEKEKNGLQLLSVSRTIKVPKVITTGIVSEVQYLLLTYEVSGIRKNNFWESFAENLCSMHDHSFEFFGLEHDNYIGSLKQSNTLTNNWIDFFIQQRLSPQLRIALNSGAADSSLANDFEKFYQKLHLLLPTEQPSLLHGDLWSGNFMTGENGEAIIFDPAVYYGHREVDLAFTKLFGGFDENFYNAYKNIHPLIKGYEGRFEIYNLYPLLVHLNLFGKGYLGQIRTTLNNYNR